MLTVRRGGYRLHVDPARPHAIVEDVDGRVRAILALAATADALGALDCVTTA